MDNIEEDFNLSNIEQNKIYILGSRGVGKTSLLGILLSKEFSDKIHPSKNGIAKVTYQKGNKNLTIKDLTDDENFTYTKKLQNELEDVILIIILFSLVDKESFEYAKTLIGFIKNSLMNNKDLSIVLLGNKHDLGIKVTKSEVHQYFGKTENLYYNEISCKTKYNIDKIIQIIDNIDIDEGMNNKNKKESISDSCIII